MSLVDWRSLPVRVKRSRKRLYSVIAEEFSLDSWMALPIEIKRSKKKLYDYIATELSLVSFDELPIECRRSTRLMYGFIQENGGGGSTDTLTVTVTDGADPITGATVTVTGDSETTGSDGKATFENTEYGDYTLTITADGYTTKTENIAFRSNHKNFTIALESASGTGTVTVTCQDSEQNPLINSAVVLSTEPIDFNSQDDTGFVAYGLTGSDGTVTLNLWDITTHQPTQDTDVPYGTYYFGGFNGDSIIKTYTGTLVVDGDETVTITLTQE